MNVEIEELFYESDFVFKVRKTIKGEKNYVVLRQIKTFGDDNWVGEVVEIKNLKDNIVEANENLSKIGKKKAVLKKCYTPKYDEIKDTVNFFLKRNSQYKEYCCERFITTVVDGYEGIKMENEIAAMCKECCGGQINCN